MGRASAPRPPEFGFRSRARHRSPGYPRPAPCRPRPISSSRPIKGDMKVARDLGGKKRLGGREAEGNVDAVAPSVASRRQASSPSQVRGTLMTILGSDRSQFFAFGNHPVGVRWQQLRHSPVPVLRRRSRAGTWSKLRPDFRTREGLVVTPSTSPLGVKRRISSISAVSRNSFMGINSRGGNLQGGRSTPREIAVPEPICKAGACR